MEKSNLPEDKETKFYMKQSWHLTFHEITTIFYNVEDELDDKWKVEIQQAMNYIMVIAPGIKFERGKTKSNISFRIITQKIIEKESMDINLMLYFILLRYKISNWII